MNTSCKAGPGAHPLGGGLKNQTAGHCILTAFSALTVFPPLTAVRRKLITLLLSAFRVKVFVPDVSTTWVCSTAPVVPEISSSVTLSASTFQVTVTTPPTATLSGVTVNSVITGTTVGDGVRVGVRVGRGVRDAV